MISKNSPILTQLLIPLSGHLKCVKYRTFLKYNFKFVDRGELQGKFSGNFRPRGGDD